MKSKDYIPELNLQEQKTGIQYSHIMLKPEAVSFLDSNPTWARDIDLRIVQTVALLGLSVMVHKRMAIGLDVVRGIYKKEIEMGVIPDWELERLCGQETDHLIVKGKLAQIKTAAIKGMFVCNTEKCAHKRLSMVDMAGVNGIFDQTCANGDHKNWGSGCGLRGYLASKNLVQPDPGETEYTVYNWIHCPDPGQDFAVDIIISTLNNRHS